MNLRSEPRIFPDQHKLVFQRGMSADQFGERGNQPDMVLARLQISDTQHKRFGKTEVGSHMLRGVFPIDDSKAGTGRVRGHGNLIGIESVSLRDTAAREFADREDPRGGTHRTGDRDAQLHAAASLEILRMFEKTDVVNRDDHGNRAK